LLLNPSRVPKFSKPASKHCLQSGWKKYNFHIAWVFGTNKCSICPSLHVLYRRRSERAPRANVRSSMSNRKQRNRGSPVQLHHHILFRKRFVNHRAGLVELTVRSQARTVGIEIMDNGIETHRTFVKTLHKMSRNIVSKSFGDFRRRSTRICHRHRRYDGSMEQSRWMHPSERLNRTCFDESVFEC
jgi:hypothetical protein